MVHISLMLHSQIHSWVNVVLTGRYEEDMTVQFSKCQEAELARMEFFKAIFFKMQGILDLTKTDRQVHVLG